jgi:hypothetical protein
VANGRCPRLCDSIERSVANRGAGRGETLLLSYPFASAARTGGKQRQRLDACTSPRFRLVLAAFLSVVPSTSALVLCTMPDGSKFVGDNPPASYSGATTVSDATPSSAIAEHDDDARSKAAMEGRELIRKREAARKKEESREEKTHVSRDNRGRIKRSSSARERFLLAHGLTRTPQGCQVDHIVPLAKGGADVPANMQLLCGEALREKEAREVR